MQSREQMIEEFLEEFELRDLLGKEILHVVEHANQPKEYKPKMSDVSILNYARQLKVERELLAEIDDWEHLGFKSKFIVKSDYVECTLKPKEGVRGRTLQIRIAMQEDNNYEIAKASLIAILTLGYEEELVHELKYRGLEFLMHF